ncbi:Sec1 family domain-containing protein 2 [Holothuria leucospilota]|uniref:Sec1 family domain-containing protein 2 n=1 Tax=Holothuria leucospilota TaxID=206669 RepID=A0A9Q1C5J8_HOLLE|nr:Sec1 family domain-containing protein 2 [Holothuria leucospilota]
MSNAANISASIINVSHSILTYVYNAVVFLDNASAEVLHWSLGSGKLFQAGARNLKQFSSFESGNESDKRAVFIVNDLLLDTAEEIIRDIITSSHFQHCTVITSVSQALHQHLSGSVTEGNNSEIESNVFFRDFEAKVVDWMGDSESQAEVVHIPLSFASICSSVFTTPAFSGLWPLLDSDVPRISKTLSVTEKKEVSSVDHLTLDMLPEARQRCLKRFVSTLSSLCEELDVNEDVYCLGATSRIIATELAGLQSAKPRRKAASNKASLLIIDRTLDLTGPAGHHYDSFLDKVFALLPSLPEHNADVSVDMSSFFSSYGNSDFKVIPPGCLAHPNVPSSGELLSNLITARKQTDALIAVNRQLVETISKAKLPMDASVTKIGRVTADSLKTKLNLFKSNQEVLSKHSGIVQLSLGCVQTLTHSHYSHHEEMATKEKLLVQMLGDESDEGIWSHMINFMTEEIEKESLHYSVEDILLLWVFLISLLGEDLTWSQEHKDQLKIKLMSFLKKSPEGSELFTDLLTDNSEDSISAVADSIISRLEGLSSCRSHLQKLGSILDTGLNTRPASYNSIFQQLINLIFDPSQPELVDLEFKSTGLRDLLKTGFRLFMNVSKPRPSNHKLMIIFVVGGVTCSEVKMIKEAVNSKSPDTQVVVGSTQIAKHIDILRLLFTEDHVYPS